MGKAISILAGRAETDLQLQLLLLAAGEDVMKMFELQLQRKGYYNGYDITVDASVANEFGAAAFRFGHSLVQSSLVRGDRNHQQLRSNVSLHEELTNPGNLYNIGSVDRLLLGMCLQPSQKRDEFITKQLTNHLFQTPRFHYGMDLAAINIQRGRDHGLAPYNAWREKCGLQQFSDWRHLLKVMSADTLRKLQSVYRCVCHTTRYMHSASKDVNDIDLFPGGMAERPVSGGLVGPTFACIIAQQFRNLRKGDRFWYENAGFESSFTPAQLQQLRKITLARILCDNLDTIDTIQPFVFLMSDHDRNPYVSCNSGLIPQFDLKPWQEQKKESHTHYPPAEIHPGYGYPSAKPEYEAGELPLHPSIPSGSQQRPQQEQVLPAFLIDEDIIDEDNSASTSESIVPAYLVDNDKLQSSEYPDHHYTTESVEPSYLIDDKFQQSKPPHHHYTTESTKPSYLIDDKFQQTNPPHHHYTTKGTKPSYLIDDKFQQFKPPQHHYTTKGTKPSYLIDDKFQQSKPHHHYTTESIKPSYLIDDKLQETLKPNHPYATESSNIPSRPSIIIIEDKFVTPPRPSDSKPAIEVFTIHPQNSYSKPHSPGHSKPHDNYGETDYNSPELDTPIYIIIPGNEPQPDTSSHYKPHEHNRPDKYHSTKPPGIKESTILRPSHFYEEYPLNELNEYHTTTKRPNYYGGPYRYSPTPSHITSYNANSRPYSFIERYNEPSYYYYGDKKGQSSGYLKFAGLWLPDEDPQEEYETEMEESSQEEQNTETSTKQEDAEVGVSTENDGKGDNSTTDDSDYEWSFNMSDVEEDSKLPEMPSIAADPQALSEVPQPIILYDVEEFGSGDDSRSLA
ncbi:hypothetical protein PR048_005007 [Dryococelus australis]|uniref:Peroxidase n=1 Tax=Dryococelus australis TaxID=614101 RepID=A0ABQ9I700_9NEOP|nr:hypothetical protein PR048_005007 [Dryococelus australis]